MHILLSMNKVLKTLEEVRIEDWIWIIYLFLASFALIANFFEKDYLINGNKTSKKTFKTINIAIFIVVFFIYLYFVLLTYSRFKERENHTSIKSMIVTNANFIAATLFLIGGIIYIFTEIISDNETDVDIL